MPATYIDRLRANTEGQYSDYTDLELATAIHAKYQQDQGVQIPFDEFKRELGIVETEAPPVAEWSEPQGILYEHTEAGPQPVPHETTIKPDAEDELSLSVESPFAEELDIEALSQAAYPDDTWTAVKKAYENIPEDFLNQYYGLKIAESETRMADLEREVAEIESRGITTSSAHSVLAQYRQELAEERVALEESQAGRENLFVDPGSVAYYASAGVSSMANTMPAIVAGVFMGPEVSLMMFYEQAKGAAYLEGREAGLAPEMAEDYATYTGLAEAIPELLPLSQILKPGVNLFTRVLKGSVAEAVQEEITEALQIGLDKGYINEDMTWAEARSRLIDAGILASIIGPTQAALAHPLVKAKEMAQQSPQRLAVEMNKELNAADFTVQEEEVLSRMDPNAVQPDSAAEAMILRQIQESARIEEEFDQLAQGPIGGDRRHDAGRATAGDRRANQALRKRVAEMSPEEMQVELLTSDVTGMPNRRAYEEAEPLPVQVSIDADSLKWVNDNMSPESGDQMLQAIGQAMAEETDQAYHISGDEFMAQVQTEAEAQELMTRVNDRLKDAEITIERPDGEIVLKKGLEITYGTGDTKNAADFQLKQEKGRREQAGERAARGEEPPGITRTRAEGQPDTQGDVAGTAETKPGKPRLAENGDDLWKAIREKTDSGVVGDDGRILYPAVNMFEGGWFRISSQGVEKIGEGGVTVNDATDAEINDLHDAISKDQAIVALMSQWGGSGRGTGSRPVKTLHSPSGLAFGAIVPKLPEAETQAEKPRTQGQEYFVNELQPALERYFAAVRKITPERLERNSIKPEGMSATEWLFQIRDRKPTWDRGRKIGNTGIQMLSKKDLWPGAEGEALRKAMLAALRATNKAPGYNQAWFQNVENGFDPFVEAPTTPQAPKVVETGKKIAPDVVKTKKGINYYQDRASAKTVLDSIVDQYPDAKIRDYELGYAVQYYDSGPYYPEKQAEKPALPVDQKKAARLRKAADAMDKQIDAKMNPAVGEQNPTPRRSRILAGMQAEGRFMERVQNMLREIANRTEAGTLDPLLADITTKIQIESLLGREKRPTVYWHPRDTVAIVEAVRNLRGIKEARELIRDVPEGNLNAPEIEAVDTLIKAADKAGRKVFEYAGVRDWIKGYNRAKKLGITTDKQWAATREALLALDRPPDPAAEKAKTIDQMERALIGKKIPGFFPTPDAVIERMLDEAHIAEGETVLEPSAGNGAIMDAINKADTGAEVEALEWDQDLTAILEAKGHKVIGSDFMEYTGGPYDKIVMNPPFEKNRDIAHVQHAYNLLKPGGRLVAIMSEHPFFANDKTSKDFRTWLEGVDHTTDKLPEAFKKGKIRTTGVNSRMVVIDKPEAQQAAKPEPVTPPSKAPGVDKIEYGKQHSENGKPSIDVRVTLKNGDTARVFMQKGNAGWNLWQMEGFSGIAPQGLIHSHNQSYTTGYTKKGAKQVLEYVANQAVRTDLKGNFIFEAEDPRDVLAGIEQAPTDRWIEIPKTRAKPKPSKVGWAFGQGNAWMRGWYRPFGASLTDAGLERIWTNGHVLVLGKDEVLEKEVNNFDVTRGERFNDKTTSDKTVRQVVERATDRRMVEVKPIALYQSDPLRKDYDQELVIFDIAETATKPLTVNADYYRMFHWLYPDAAYKVAESTTKGVNQVKRTPIEQAHIVVYEGDTVVGIMSPIQPGGKAFDEMPIQKIKQYAEDAGANDITEPLPRKKKRGGGGSGTVAMSAQVTDYGPGAAYAGFVNDLYDPTEFTTEFNRDPIRREKVLQDFAKGVGTRLYQGRIKGQMRALGFFRPGLDEVRIKNMNDLEVAAHEIAHFMDDKLWNGFGRRRGEKETRPWLHGPNHKTYAKELKSVSYDEKKVYEGYAEFMRHWMTRPETVAQRAPQFFHYWENFVRENKEYGPALLKAQADIMGWFNQRAIERAASKIGDSGIAINDALVGAGDRARQAVFDDLEGLLEMETQLTGERAAVSGGPYQTARLMRGAHAIVDGALRYGPPVIRNEGEWAFRDRDGNLDSAVQGGEIVANPAFKEWGLRDVLAPVNHQLDEWVMYAVGMSAQELATQGRENLFTKAEIDAMIDMGRDRPHFKQALDDYQKWNDAILDFAIQTGILSKNQRKNFRRAIYMPFYRVGQGQGVTKQVSVKGHIKPIHMLTGGTQNLSDILGNMVQNASGLIVEGVKNQARAQIVKFAGEQVGSKGKLGGGNFIAKIAKDTKSVSIDQDQVIDKFLQGALGVSYAQYKSASKLGGGDPTIDAMISNIKMGGMDDFVKFWMYGQPPKGSDLVAVMKEGKPVFYQVADPLLLRSLESFTRKHPGQLRRWFMAFRRLGQASITLTADFMTANMWRDTLHGSIFSQHGFRPFWDSIKGMNSRMREDASYRKFIANGGGFSSYLVDPRAFEANLRKFYEQKGIDFRTVIHTPQKMLLALELIADAFEVSTRLGEHQRAVKRGKTARTSAYHAREVSTDFAMRGDAEAINVMYDTVLFLKAGMNGLDRVYRGFTKDPNRGAIMVKTAALASASAALYALNRGNPCYDDLEDWDKDTHWHVFLPKNADAGGCDGQYIHMRFPKIWEIGAVASAGERTLELVLDGVEKGYADGKKYARHLQQIFIDLFKMEYIPQGVMPIAEVYFFNKNRFTEREIENKQQRELLPFARYSPYTNKTLVDIAALTAELPPELQFSPLKAEALVRGYLNTWGMYGLMISDEVLKGDELPEWRTDQMPVIRRFTKGHPLRHTRYETEFWELVREAAMYAKTGKKMAEEGKDLLAERFMEQDPAPYLKALQGVKQSVTAINDGMVALSRDPELTPEQKRVAIDSLQKDKNDIYKEFMTGINTRRRGK